MNKPVLGRLLLLSSVSIFAGCHSAGQQPERPQEKVALRPPTGTPKRPQGMPAIAVKPGATQPFSKEEVVAYFKTHKLPKNLGSADRVQVENLEFLTSGEASKRLQGASTGLADNERVVFVTLSGQLIFTGPKGKPATFERGYAIFDAATGNLLMIGTLERRE